MRRHIIWYILAVLWGALAIAALLRHRGGLAVLECAIALFFAIIGIVVKRRDAALVARYTANRPR